MTVIFIRAILLYLLLTLLFRFMGKRQVGELEVSDLVATLLLSEIAALPIDDPDIPLTYALMPIFLIVSLEVVFTFLEIKWNPLKRFFEGKSVMLIDKGEIKEAALRKMRVTVNELISECRIQGIGDISQVNYAILEPNGKLSVLPKMENSPITPATKKAKGKDGGILHLLVIDGTLQKETIEKLKISEGEFADILDRHKATPEDLFLLGIDDNGQSFAKRKEKQK